MLIWSDLYYEYTGKSQIFGIIYKKYPDAFREVYTLFCGFESEVFWHSKTTTSLNITKDISSRLTS